MTFIDFLNWVVLFVVGLSTCNILLMWLRPSNNDPFVPSPISILLGFIIVVTTTNHLGVWPW